MADNTPQEMIDSAKRKLQKQAVTPMTAPKRAVKKVERLKKRAHKRHAKGKPTSDLYARYTDAAKETGMSLDAARSLFMHDLPTKE
jgi:hypothetical protein